MTTTTETNATAKTASTDWSPDWNYIAEQAVAGVLGLVPEVGSLLSAMVYILWPEGQDDVWSEIEDQVEALIDQELTQHIQEEVDSTLAGLEIVLQDYIDAVQFASSDPGYVSDTWVAAFEFFRGNTVIFQQTGYQAVLLPQFGQFATLCLGLLRDGVLGGASWGWSAELVDSNLVKLQQLIVEYGEYVDEVYQTELASVRQQHSGTSAQAWTAINQFVRETTLTVLDFASMWPYFDPSVYSGPVEVELPREIYSDVLGTNTDSGPMRVPSPPTGPIEQITVWGWDRIDAAQLTYAPGEGPAGQTTTARMGDSSGGSDAPPHGGVFDVANNPVITAVGWSGSIINAMQFTFADGSQSNLLGGGQPGGTQTSWSFPTEQLSSLWINGVSNYYKSADCVVFGFKYSDAITFSPRAVEALYVTAPTDEAAKAVAGAHAVPADAEASRAAWQSARRAASSKKRGG